MIGLDTIVLVRYLVQDDPRQSAAATRLMESLDPHHPAVIQPIVFCELVWVLETAYDYPRLSIATVIRGLLNSREVLIPDRESVAAALLQYGNQNADFADYLIQLLNLKQGCSETLTFDKKATRSPYAKLLTDD